MVKDDIQLDEEQEMIEDLDNATLEAEEKLGKTPSKEPSLEDLPPPDFPAAGNNLHCSLGAVIKSTGNALV